MTSRVGDLLRLVRFSHTLFALPFALAGYVLATQQSGFTPQTLLWVLVAMVGMRTAAMSFNRWCDADIDGCNPRTADREIPAGRVSRSLALSYTVLFSLVFFLAAWQLNSLTLKLAPVAWVVCLGYSICKRFTSWGHLVLGLALGLSPVGAWVAVTGTLEATPLWMGAVVLLWTAGFDILYSTMDREFDVAAGLNSVPVAFGERGALWIARGLHVAMLGAWAGLATQGDFGWPLWGAGALAAILVVAEHVLVDPQDLGRMNLVFFKLNVVVSGVMLLACLVEVYGPVAR